MMIAKRINDAYSERLKAEVVLLQLPTVRAVADSPKASKGSNQTDLFCFFFFCMRARFSRHYIVHYYYPCYYIANIPFRFLLLWRGQRSVVNSILLSVSRVKVLCTGTTMHCAESPSSLIHGDLANKKRINFI